jgi:hypothetical protein
MTLGILREAQRERWLQNRRTDFVYQAVPGTMYWADASGATLVRSTQSQVR